MCAEYVYIYLLHWCFQAMWVRAFGKLPNNKTDLERKTLLHSVERIMFTDKITRIGASGNVIT